MNTETYRLTLEDGTFFEKEFPVPAIESPELRTHRACREIIMNLQGNAAKPVGFCLLLDDGSGDAYYLDDVLEVVLKNLGYNLDGQYCDLPESTEEDILDSDLQAARDSLRKATLQQLCYRAIEVMNVGAPDGPEGDQIKGYLHDMHIEIVKRVAFWAFIVLALAYCAAIGGGVLVMCLAGGIIETSALHWTQGLFGAGVIGAALGIANKRLIALENWAATWGANLAARRRKSLTARRKKEPEHRDDE